MVEGRKLMVIMTRQRSGQPERAPDSVVRKVPGVRASVRTEPIVTSTREDQFGDNGFTVVPKGVTPKGKKENDVRKK